MHHQHERGWGGARIGRVNTGCSLLGAVGKWWIQREEESRTDVWLFIMALVPRELPICWGRAWHLCWKEREDDGVRGPKG